MKMELRAKGVRVTGALRAHVERKLRVALGRFGHRVRAVRVHLTDINGPKGGEDIECLIHARLAPTGVLVIQETRCDPFAAVARASDRIGHSLARRLHRRRARRRGR